MTDHPDIGHNNPPEAIELASGVINSVSAFMADHPVVQDEEVARATKLQIDRAKLCIKDIEAELEGKSKPLRDKLEIVRGMYRGPRRMLGDLLEEMLSRLQSFVKTEEHRREQLALIAAAKAAEAERLALEAERIERERLDDAAKGEIGVDVAEVIANADQAFEDYQKAERRAILAQKQTHVKIGGGLSRAIGLRKKETLILTDYIKAISAMGFTDSIMEGILKSARAYRTVHGKLPEGVTSKVEEYL